MVRMLFKLFIDAGTDNILEKTIVDDGAKRGSHGQVCKPRKAFILMLPVSPRILMHPITSRHEPRLEVTGEVRSGRHPHPGTELWAPEVSKIRPVAQSILLVCSLFRLFDLHWILPFRA
jgi:hypothetical protein